MPNEKAEIDEFTDGIPLGKDEINQSSGEPNGQSSLDHALGLSEEDTEDTETDNEDDELDEDEATGEKPKGKSKGASKGNDPNELGDNYARFVQQQAEEAYATALFRARNEEDYLSKLVQSKEPIDQRIAKKLLERNDFGAKTIEEYRQNIRKKEIGDDPVKQKLAANEDRLDRLERTQLDSDWNTWKKENAVKGEAAELANDIHTRYPDMPYGEVMDMVKGRLGGSHTGSSKNSTSAIIGGGAPQESSDSTGLDSVNPNLANKLLPNRKETAKFAKSYVKQMRR